MFKNLSLASLLTALFLTQAQAAPSFDLKQSRFELSYRDLRTHQELRFSGNLQLGKGERAETLLRALREKVSEGKDLRVVLALFGGELSFVNRIYTVLKNKCSDRGYRTCQITTVVEMFRHCASACVPLFMVGDRRLAAERSNWGFHQAATAGGYLMIPLMSETVLWQKGVSRDWLLHHHEMFRTLRITWLTPERMHGSNIITGIIPHPTR